jgi:hypothetical protein
LPVCVPALVSQRSLGATRGGGGASAVGVHLRVCALRAARSRWLGAPGWFAPQVSRRARGAACGACARGGHHDVTACGVGSWRVGGLSLTVHASGAGGDAAGCGGRFVTAASSACCAAVGLHRLCPRASPIRGREQRGIYLSPRAARGCVSRGCGGSGDAVTLRRGAAVDTVGALRPVVFASPPLCGGAPPHAGSLPLARPSHGLPCVRVPPPLSRARRPACGAVSPHLGVAWPPWPFAARGVAWLSVAAPWSPPLWFTLLPPSWLARGGTCARNSPVRPAGAAPSAGLRGAQAPGERGGVPPGAVRRALSTMRWMARRAGCRVGWRRLERAARLGGRAALFIPLPLSLRVCVVDAGVPHSGCSASVGCVWLTMGCGPGRMRRTRARVRLRGWMRTGGGGGGGARSDAW